MGRRRGRGARGDWGDIKEKMTGHMKGITKLILLEVLANYVAG